MTWNPELYGVVALAEPRSRIRRKRVFQQARGIASLPGFAESLRLLLVEEEYTLEDVSLMFGVSRERIRQLAEKLGLTERPQRGGLWCVRVWQDDEHRFRPVRKRILKQVATYTRRSARQQAIKARYTAHWAEAVAELKDLARQLERTPTRAELSRRLGLRRNPGYLTAYLFPSRQKGYQTSLASLYADAGLTVRGRGSAGHLPHLFHTTHCRRGHPRTPENVAIYQTKGHEVWQCIPCRKLRRRRYAKAAR